MKLSKKLVLAGAAVLPLFFSACGTTEPPPSSLSETEQKSLIIDTPLQDKIAVEFIRTWPSENGLTKVLIRARIKTYSMWDWIFNSYETLDIAYRVAWYNDKGVEVPEGKKPAWNYLEAEYGEELGFGSMAPSPEIKAYKLFIRLSKPQEADTVVQEQKPEAPASAEDPTKPAPKTAREVKTPPSSVTPIKQEVKTAPAAKTTDGKTAAPAAKTVKTQAQEEAEADAAAIRQATPAKKK